MNFKSIHLDETMGRPYRKRYYEGVLNLVAEKASEAAARRAEVCTPQAMAASREEYRTRYVEMLGWPLTAYRSEAAPRAEKKLVQETEELEILRLSLETLPGLWFEGLLFIPKQRDEKAPLTIINPGGSYCVEDLIAHDGYECEQYRNIGGRALEKGSVLYAPQFLLWIDEEDEYKHPTARQHLDAKLKAMGGSIAALEIFNVRRAIDYLIQKEPVDPQRIGMMGLSYGGFYALYISAAEPRIKSTFSSCFFCDRFCSEAEPTGCRFDWLFPDSALRFFDAEVAALIAPRALYIENGVRDSLFPLEKVTAEAQRLKPFFRAADAEERLLLYVGENGHRVSDGDLGFDFFMKHLL